MTLREIPKNVLEAALDIKCSWPFFNILETRQRAIIIASWIDQLYLRLEMEKDRKAVNEMIHDKD